MMHIYLAIAYRKKWLSCPQAYLRTINFKSTFPGPNGNVSSQHENMMIDWWLILWRLTFFIYIKITVTICIHYKYTYSLHITKNTQMKRKNLIQSMTGDYVFLWWWPTCRRLYGMCSTNIATAWTEVKLW